MSVDTGNGYPSAEGQNKENHFGCLASRRKHVACLRTIHSLINNMVTGATKVRINLGIVARSEDIIGIPI
jgi:hypothetical protein